MDDLEVRALVRQVALAVIQIEEEKRLELPLEITITDASDLVLADYAWEKEKPRARDVFGIRDQPSRFGEARLPVTITIKDPSGAEIQTELSQDTVRDFIADQKLN